LVIGVSLVSFWKSLSPSDFQAWFASHSHLVGRLMIPLGAGGIAVSVAAVAACRAARVTRRRWLLIAAASARGVAVICPLFVAATNEWFVRGGRSDAAARSLLYRWAIWHWIRTGLGALGFLAALRSLHG